MAASLRIHSLGARSTEQAAQVQQPPGWGVLDYGGGTILMRSTNAIEQQYRLQACAKEPWTAAWLDTIGPGDLLFNVGACVGSYALIAAYRGAQVVAVEASPINAARLAENAAANRLGDRMTAILAVCGPSDQPQGTRLAGEIPGAANITIGNPHPKGIVLPGVTLDSLAEVYGQPSHLLIDVDGGELGVLRGGAETLAGVSEVLIEVSREPRIAEGCARILAEGGLSLVRTWDERGGVPIEEVFYSLHRRVT